MNRSARGGSKSVKRVERSNGLDTALYKTTITFDLIVCMLVGPNVNMFNNRMDNVYLVETGYN